MLHSYLISISAKLFASAKQTEREKQFYMLKRIETQICQIISHLTSEPLEPLLSPPPPQHQQPNEDYNDTHQHTRNCHHHLQTFATTGVALTYVRWLHQWCNGACAKVMICVVTYAVRQSDIIQMTKNTLCFCRKTKPFIVCP